MQSLNFEEAVEKIVAQDPRYEAGAYVFVREALDHIQKTSGRISPGQLRHVTGQELLQGIREFGLRRYGPMTLMLLEAWGIRRCDDFGDVVFNMVEHGLLSKTDRDSKDDFKGGYEFFEAFRKPFLPSKAPGASAVAPKPAQS